MQTNPISEARTMRDLVAITLPILRKLKSKGPIVQVCGPISTGGFNNIEKNLEVFNDAIYLLKQSGLNVFDQTVFQDAIIRIVKYHPEDKHYKTVILTDFFRDIFASGYVQTGYFIPNWKTSKGSRWEHGILEHFNIERIEMDKEWFPHQYSVH